jgi:hypothetical protein
VILDIFVFEKRRRAAHHYIKKKGKLRSKRTSTVILDIEVYSS